MKPKSFHLARLGLATVALSILATPTASAINLYWDTNNDTAGFGTAGGTISSTTLGTATSGWTESTTGVNVVAGNSYNAQSNTWFFGTNTDGLATGTITVDGKVSAAGNIGNLNFGSASGVITFNGINSGVIVTGNNALGMQNVQNGGAAPGVIINSDFQAASLNSNGNDNGYVQFNGTYTGTSNITLTRGTWEHGGSSYLRSTTANTVADFTKNIGINSSSSRFKYNSTTNQVISGNITGTNTSAQFIKANVSTLILSGTASTYVGKFQVSGGTLSAEHDKALGNTTLVTVDGGNLDVRGATVGTVTLGTNADLAMSSGMLTLDLGTIFDQVVGNGAGSQFDITGGTFDLNLGAGFSYANTYQVLFGFGGTNSVSGLNFTGITGHTAALDTSGVLSFTVIPEPRAALLGGIGLLALLRRRRA